MYNIVEQPMRDTSTDYETGWLNKGLYYGHYADMAKNEYGSPGLGELGLENLGRIPEKGRRHVEAALEDPQTRPAVEALLRRPDAAEALVAQFESDVAEAYKPTGKKDIVFKDLAAHFGGKLQEAENAIMEALPTQDTPEGRDAFDIVQMADDKQGALTHYYTQIGLEAMSPEWFEKDVEGVSGYDDEDEVMEEFDEFGLGITKKAKKIMKGVAIGAAVVAGAALTAGVIVPAIGSALPAIGGAVTSVGKTIFGAFKPSAPVEEDPGVLTTSFAALQSEADMPKPSPAAVDWDGLAQTALTVWQLQNTDPAASAAYQQQMIEYLMAQGFNQGEADSAVAGVLAQIVAAQGQPPSPEPPPTAVTVTTGVPAPPPMVAPPAPVKAAIGPEILLLGLGAAFLLAGGGGGGRRRYRRNPRRRRRRAC